MNLEGVDLVKGGLVNEILLDTDPQTGFYTPYWKMLASYSYDEFGKPYLTEESLKSAQVFDLT